VEILLLHQIILIKFTKANGTKWESIKLLEVPTSKKIVFALKFKSQKVRAVSMLCQLVSKMVKKQELTPLCYQQALTGNSFKNLHLIKLVIG
jgi:hypothetical protein